MLDFIKKNVDITSLDQTTDNPMKRGTRFLMICIGKMNIILYFLFTGFFRTWSNGDNSTHLYYTF